MKTLPILYTFRRCPYAIRTRLSLAYHKIPVIIREIVLKNKPPQLLQISPKGTVPVLQLEEDKVIEESIDIMFWSLKDRSFLGQAERKTRKFIQDFDQFAKTDLTYYKYPDRYPKLPQEEYLKRCCQKLDLLEKMLTTSEYLLSNQLTFLDLALYPFIRQLSKVDENWFENSPYVRIKEWKSEFDSSHLMRAVMKKYEPWEENHPPLLENWTLS